MYQNIKKRIKIKISNYAKAIRFGGNFAPTLVFP